MSIYNRICSGSCDHEGDTGNKATIVYLGRAEMKMLSEWAYEEGYIDSPEFKNTEGDHRPEISGLFVYQVNSDTHMAFS
jgi:hypothetical protein